MKKICCLIVVFLLFVSVSQAQWTPTTGPGGSNVRCLSIVYNDIFAGCENYPYGVYYSYNNGNSWNGRGYINSSVRTIVHNGTYLFIGGNSGVMLSTNYGVNWFAANNGLSGQGVYHLISISGTLIAGSSGNGIYKSTNNGGSWIQSGLSGMEISAMLYAGSSIFAGTPFSGLYRSTNNGSTWSAVNTGLNSTFIMSLATNGSNLYAGAGNNVYLSNNNGNTWTQTSLNSAGTIYALAATGSYILAGTEEQGFYRSTNSGSTWTQVSFNKWVNTIIFKGTTAYLGAAQGYSSFEGVYRSNDYGLNWEPSGINNRTVKCLTSNGSNVFAGIQGGVFITTNNGGVWNLVNNGLTNTDVQCLASGGGYVFAGTYDGGVFRSNNNGSSWTAANTGLISQYVHTLYYTSGYLFAGTNGAGVFRTTNNGDVWTAVNNGISNLNVFSLAGNGTIVLAGTESGVFLSSNNGSSWSSSGLSQNIINTVAFNGSNILASTLYNGIYRSSDNGQSWSLCGFSSIFVNSLISYNNKFFAGAGSNGTGYGIFMSTDNGISWINRNQGFEFPPSVRALHVANNYIFAGMDTQSVWRREMSDIIGVNKISELIPSDYVLHQNYPNPFNPSTNIKFSVPKSSFVKLTVYDIIGREVETLVNEQLEAGTYEVKFDGSTLQSGVYFYRFNTEFYSETKKSLIIK